MSTIGDRLRIAREATGLSQAAFGAIAGVKKRAQINYEQGLRAPDADYFARLSKHGVDVQFVIAGNPSPTSDFQSPLHREQREKRSDESISCGKSDAKTESRTPRPTFDAKLGRESQPARLDQATLRRALKVVLAAVRAEGVDVSVDGLARVVVLIYQHMLARQSAADIAAHVQRLIDEAIHAGD